MQPSTFGGAPVKIGQRPTISTTKEAEKKRENDEQVTFLTTTFRSHPAECKTYNIGDDNIGGLDDGQSESHARSKEEEEEEERRRKKKKKKKSDRSNIIKYRVNVPITHE